MPKLSINIASNSDQQFLGVQVNDIVFATSDINQKIHLGIASDRDPALTIKKNAVHVDKPLYFTGNLVNNSPFQIAQVLIENSNITAYKVEAERVQFNRSLGSSNWSFISDLKLQLKRNVDGSTPLTITENCIGINNTSPTSALDVNGESHISGNMIINGDLTVTGQTTFDQSTKPPLILDGTIVTPMLSNAAVAEAKIADRAVTSDKLSTALTVSDLSVYNSICPTQDRLVSLGTTEIPFKGAYISGEISLADDKIRIVPYDGSIYFVANHPSVTMPLMLNSNAVRSHMIAPCNVTTDTLAPLAITNDKISNNAVRTRHILDSAITTTKILDSAVTSDKIQWSAVKESHIRDENVSTIKLTDRAVTSIKIAASNILTEHIANSNITASKMGTQAVNTVNVVPRSVTTSLIAYSNITEELLANNIIDTDHLKSGSVTAIKLAGTLVADLAAQINIIQPASVGVAELADNSVTSHKLQPLAVTPYHLAFRVIDQIPYDSLIYEQLNSNLPHSFTNLGWNSNQQIALVTLSNETVTVAGQVLATNISSTSDRRIKRNIQPLTGALAKLLSLSGYTFDMDGVDKRQTGLIAQDVEAVLPEVVSEYNNIKAVSYGNMMGLVVEAIKELYYQRSKEL